MKYLLYLCLISLFSCSHNHNSGHWEYDGKESPDHWHELSPNYRACKVGHKQSPIDLDPESAILGKHSLEIKYHATPSIIVNNGHTIEFDMQEKNVVMINNKVFELIQLHFHADSEHTVRGYHYPAEMHLVHKSKDGELAVLGFLIEVASPTNATKDLDHIFDKIPKVGQKIETLMHLEALVPKDKNHYYYQGSLTTPPCSENVSWVVFDEHLKVPSSQLKKFKAYYSHNYRPTQKVY